MRRMSFLNQGKITRSRLVLRLRSNSFFNQEVLRLASRFEVVDEEYIEELKDEGEIENTINSTEWSKNVFKKWANEKNLQANLEEYEIEIDVLDQRLSQFQAFRNSVIFPLSVINKQSQWILVKLSINITCVFRSC